MKNLVMAGMLSAMLVAVSACSADDFPASSSATGHITVKVDLDSYVASSQGSRAEYSDVTVDDLTLRLTSADGSYTREGKPSEFTQGLDVKVGSYTLEAVYGSADQDGFEMPYFYGTQDIRVEDQETAEVALTASLANAMVTVVYTDAFKAYFPQYSAEVLSSASRTTKFSATETRPAYIATGTCKLFVDVTKYSGATARFQPAEFEAEARHHYTVTMDVVNVGEGKLVITFDDQLATENVNIDLSDQLLNKPAPTLKIGSYTPDVNGEIRFSTVEGTPLSVDLKAVIMAQGGLAEVNMVTSSPALTAKGWPADINLLAATSGQQATLTSLGFEGMGLWRNPDRMATVDFSQACRNLSYVDGQNNENRITLYVKDKMTKVCEPVTVVIDVTKMEVVIGNAMMNAGADEFELDLYYPGADIASYVKLQVKNDRGTWSDAPYTFSTIASRSGDYNYHLTATIPADFQAPLTVRAIVNGTEIKSNEEQIKTRTSEFSLSVSDVDVWARKATVAFTALGETVTADEAARIAQMQVKTGSGAWTTMSSTVSGNTVTISGLTPGTAYQVKALLNGDASRSCAPATFTTEAAAQLPNAGMEDWCQTSSGRNWELIWPGASEDASVWGTNNPLTTSQGSDYAYCRISGTISTTDAHSGNAALIRTVGWGSGNSATGSGGNSGATKYVDAGLLHLGASRTTRPDGYGDRQGSITTDDLDCGIAFGSRPASLSFWYKYTAKNSADKGVAYVEVKSAAGAILASGTVTLDAAGSYQQVSIPLNYAAGATKAAKIYVMFQSTNNRDFLKKSDANLSGPGFANLSRGTFMGSQLYVDDITLNY